MNQPIPDLRTLQEHLFKAITTDDEKQLLPFIKPSHIPESARFKVYKNTSFENLCNALKITFPGIWKLIGEECARSVSYVFTKDIKNLPSNGYIDDWGRDFSKFLSTVSELSDLKYLEDYAEFEWLQHSSFCAMDADVLDPVEL